MHIFITGICGFIGSNLAQLLKNNGYKVSGIDNLNSYYSPQQKLENFEKLSKLNIKIYKEDILEADLGNILKDTEIIYHLAAQPGISPLVPLSDYINLNIIATDKLIKAVKNNFCLKLFVNISTSSVYGKSAISNEDSLLFPSSYYGITKLAAEQLVMSSFRNENFPACSIRLFSVYGPGERTDKLYPQLIINSLKHLEVSIYEGSENHKRSYTYIDDITEGLKLILDNINKCKGQIYNLGNPESKTTKEAIEIVEKILAYPVLIKHLPARLGDQLETRADITKIQKDLGFKPKTNLYEGINNMINYYKN